MTQNFKIFLKEFFANKQNSLIVRKIALYQIKKAFPQVKKVKDCFNLEASDVEFADKIIVLFRMRHNTIISEKFCEFHFERNDNSHIEFYDKIYYRK